MNLQIKNRMNWKLSMIIWSVKEIGMKYDWIWLV